MSLTYVTFLSGSMYAKVLNDLWNITIVMGSQISSISLYFSMRHTFDDRNIAIWA